MLGQLQNAGNTTTLAHYLYLLERAGMITGLQKYATSTARRRSSSPKLQVLNTALMTAISGLNITTARTHKAFWGRLTESAIGAHLINGAANGFYEVFYWRNHNQEVNFILKKRNKLIAIEVKSQHVHNTTSSGLRTFSSSFPTTRKLILGGSGIRIEKFLLKPPEYWIT